MKDIVRKRAKAARDGLAQYVVKEGGVETIRLPLDDNESQAAWMLIQAVYDRAGVEYEVTPQTAYAVYLVVTALAEGRWDVFEATLDSRGIRLVCAQAFDYWAHISTDRLVKGYQEEDVICVLVEEYGADLDDLADATAWVLEFRPGLTKLWKY